MQEITLDTKKALFQKYSAFVRANAKAVWATRGADGEISSWWDGPSGSKRQVAVETQGSGVAALTCAVRLDKSLHSLEQSSITPHDGQLSASTS